jgi:hypothetical protein
METWQDERGIWLEIRAGSGLKNAGLGAYVATLGLRTGLRPRESGVVKTWALP